LGPMLGATWIGVRQPERSFGRPQDLANTSFGHRAAEVRSTGRRPCRGGFPLHRVRPAHLISGLVEIGYREAGEALRRAHLSDPSEKPFCHQIARGPVFDQALDLWCRRRNASLPHGIGVAGNGALAAVPDNCPTNQSQELHACSRHKAAGPPTDRPRPSSPRARARLKSADHKPCRRKNSS